MYYQIEKLFMLHSFPTFQKARSHGRRKDFFQDGQQGIFPKLFPGVDESGEIWFLPAQIERTTWSVDRVRTIQCSVQFTTARFRHQLHLK